jgi:hypothetical protein
MTHEERILLRLKKKPMTTDQLAKDMKAPRSTVVASLNKLWNRRNICVVEYKKTGATPARIWGIGKVDRPRPPTKTREQRNAQQRERRRIEKERVAKPVEAVKPDIAAAWIKPVKEAKPKPVKVAKPKPLKASKPKITVVPKRDFAASWF